MTRLSRLATARAAITRVRRRRRLARARRGRGAIFRAARWLGLVGTRSSPTTATAGPLRVSRLFKLRAGPDPATVLAALAVPNRRRLALRRRHHAGRILPALAAVVATEIIFGVMTLTATRPHEPERATSIAASSAPRGLPTARRDHVLIGTVIDPQGTVARRLPYEGAPEIASFAPVNAQGARQVFLLLGREPGIAADPEDDWFKALLPLRPNGTTGYIPAAALSLSRSPYSLVVDRETFTLTVWKGPRPIHRFPVGLGTGQTPTPVGLFYLASLLEPPVEGTIYGDYAYGLSGYSEVVTDWEGGGIVGLHGTNDPSSIGRRASHGCIRMRNEDIARLVDLLPLGTPILII